MLLRTALQLDIAYFSGHGLSFVTVSMHTFVMYLQSVTELEERARVLVARVDEKEQGYIDAVMAVNGFCAEFPAEMEAKVTVL
jgi:hypothetical protein